MIFERATEGDFRAVNKLARQVTEFHAQWDHSLEVVDYPYPMDYFLECIREDSIHESTIYVAKQDDDVVGYMRFYLWKTNSTVNQNRMMLSIDDIGVEESLRGRGIGTQMMEKLRDLARGEGCSALNLYVDAPNSAAIAFYEKCGFHIRNHGMTMKL